MAETIIRYELTGFPLFGSAMSMQSASKIRALSASDTSCRASMSTIRLLALAT